MESPYSDKMDAASQVETEEAIAAAIFDNPDVEVSEEDAAHLGRYILHLVLEKFRPDLFPTD